MLNKIFHLKEKKTSVSKEFIAGLSTFMAMSYAILVIPAILSQTGMDYDSVYSATIIASMIGTLIIGLVANVPYALSSGIGLASIFTYTLCSGLGYTYQQALTFVLLCGIIGLIITLSSVRKKIIEAIPKFFQDAITVGIGLFISYIGLINSGIIVFNADKIEKGLAIGVTPSLGNLTSGSTILAVIGLITLIFLLVKKVRGAYLIGIIVPTIVGLIMGLIDLPDFSNYSFAPHVTLMQFDFKGLITHDNGILVFLMTLFSISLSDLFDTLGVFIGTGKKSGIFKIDKDGQMPKNLEKAMVADSLGTITSAIFGTSNVETYLESAVGIESGGRTGLTSLFVAFFFLIALFLAPVVSIVPMVCVAPVLIVIGVSMISNVLNINFHDLKEAIPAFFIIVMMPLAYSITTGIEWGFITYVLVNIFSPKEERSHVSPIMYIFAILFMVKYVYQFLG